MQLWVCAHWVHVCCWIQLQTPGNTLWNVHQCIYQLTSSTGLRILHGLRVTLSLPKRCPFYILRCLFISVCVLNETCYLSVFDLMLNMKLSYSRDTARRSMSCEIMIIVRSKSLKRGDWKCRIGNIGTKQQEKAWGGKSKVVKSARCHGLQNAGVEIAAR